MTKVAIRQHDDTAQSQCIHASTPFVGVEVNFNRQVTLSPRLQDEAWNNLNMNTRAAEFNRLPQTLHIGFIHALQSFKFA